MSSRDEILQRLHDRLAGAATVELPPVPEVWPRENPDQAAMADRFETELKAVHGEIIRCASIEDAQKRLAELVEQNGWTSLGVMYRPICSDAVKNLDEKIVRWTKPNWAPTEMAELSAGVVAAEALLADTGSSVIACPTAEDRLLCYLVPACVILARKYQLAEHLPAAWESIAQQCAQPNLSGEFVIVTGPSRTSDIEKKLILGVHGPKKIFVILIG